MGLKHRNVLLTSVASDSCLIFGLIKAELFGYFLIFVGLFYASKFPYIAALCVPFIVLDYFYIVLWGKKKELMKEKKFQYVFFPSG